jgi:hypothetical protein
VRKSKFSESQIVGILREAESGVPVAELAEPQVRARVREPVLPAQVYTETLFTIGGRHS